MALLAWAQTGCRPAASPTIGGPTATSVTSHLVPSSTPTAEESPKLPSSPTPAATAPTATRTPAPTHTPTPEIRPDTAMGGLWVLRQVSMFDAGTGWGMASDVSEQAIAVLRTADGGQSWTRVSPADMPTVPGAFPGPARAAFLDGDRAWLMSEPSLLCRQIIGDCPSDYADGPSSLWYTGNGGRTWQLRTIPEWYTGGPDSFDFIDDQHGWILSEIYGGAGSSLYVFWRTQDGGRSWEQLMADVHGVHEFSLAVDFADASTGLMTFAHDNYYVLSPYLRWTHDGGRTWEELVTPPAPPDDPDLFDLNREDAPFCGTYSGRLFSGQTANLVVLCHDPVGLPRSPMVALLYSTSDGGETWQIRPYPGGRVLFVDSMTGWSVGDLIHQTRDGGATWTEMSRVSWQGQFSFVDEFRGWAVGEELTAAGRSYELYTTGDGGRTWIALSPSLAP